MIVVIVIQSLSCVQPFATPWTAAHQASLFLTVSQILLRLMSIESVMPLNYLILSCPLLLLASVFPRIKVFSKELAVASGGQSIGASAPPSMEFYRQRYWSGLPFPSPGDLPDPGIEPGFPALQAVLYHLATREAQMLYESAYMRYLI